MFSRRTCLTLLAVAPATATAIPHELEPTWHGIPIRPDLYQKIEACAAADGMTVDTVIDRAVSQWLARNEELKALLETAADLIALIKRQLGVPCQK